MTISSSMLANRFQHIKEIQDSIAKLQGWEREVREAAVKESGLIPGRFDELYDKWLKTGKTEEDTHE